MIFPGFPMIFPGFPMIFPDFHLQIWPSAGGRAGSATSRRTEPSSAPTWKSSAPDPIKVRGQRVSVSYRVFLIGVFIWVLKGVFIGVFIWVYRCFYRCFYMGLYGGFP